MSSKRKRSAEMYNDISYYKFNSKFTTGAPGLVVYNDTLSSRALAE